MPSLDSSRLRTFARCLLATLAVAFAVAALPVAAHAEDLHCAGNEAFDASLVARARERVAAAGADAAAAGVSVQNISTTGDLSLSTTGEARVVVIRVSFPGSAETGEPAMTIPADQTQDDLRAIFNGGTGSLTTGYPYESLRGYYERASYGKLDIQAAYVVDYTAAYSRSHYTGNVSELFYEALAGVEGQVDYSQCDANNDGKIDGVYLQYAGQDDSWGGTWWPTKHTLKDDSRTFGGKIARGGVLLRSQLNGFNNLTATLIHETGHLLGLPDLYRYNDTGQLGLRAYDMMCNNEGDINGYCKWMLDWIDGGKITYVHVSADGVDVRRAGTTAIEHHEGAVDEVLQAYSREGEPSATGGFIAVSDDESILEGNLFCNFYLVEYIEHAGNDSIAPGEVPMGQGVRIYRVQGAYDPERGFKHSNTSGGAHEQLIEALEPTEGAETTKGFFALWQPGSSVTPASSPSTNYGESLLRGFSGIMLEVLEGADGAGRVRIGYAAAPEQEPLALTCESIQVNGTSGSYTFRLSRDADRGRDYRQAKLIVDGIEYGMPSWTYTEGERSLKVYVKLAAGIIKPTSKVQIKMPAGSFVLSYDSPDEPAEVSEDLFCDVPTPTVSAVEATGTYENASVPTDSMRMLSDIFELGGAKYFLAYTYDLDAYTAELGLYRIAADGKACEKVELEGAADLVLPTMNTLDVCPYGNDKVFVRLRSFMSESADDQVPTSIADIVIDAGAGKVLGMRTGGGSSAQAYEGKRESALVALGDTVVSVTRLSGYGWASWGYRVADGSILADYSEWTGDAAKKVSCLFDAGEGYLATVAEGSSEGGTATVSLRKTSGLSNIASLRTTPPSFTVELTDNYGINAVRVAGERVYVLACSNHMADGRDHFANELGVYNLTGGLVSTNGVPGLSVLFSRRVNLRISPAGMVSICQTDTNEAGYFGMRSLQTLFDGSLASKGSLTNFGRSIGAWVGERWLSVDYPQIDGDVPLPERLAVSWTLGAPLAGKPVDPSDPSNPGDPSSPSTPQGSGTSASGDVSVKNARAKSAGALASTGDRTLALVGAVLLLGLILVIAGIVISRRRRR